MLLIAKTSCVQQVRRWSASERRSVVGQRQSFCQEAVGLKV